MDGTDVNAAVPVEVTAVAVEAPVLVTGQLPEVLDEVVIMQKKRRRRKSEVSVLFTCPAPGCDKTFASHAGLYLHKRSTHPDIVVKRQKLEDCTDPHVCPVPGCGKTFVSAGGLCLHRQSKHPELPSSRRARKERREESAAD